MNLTKIASMQKKWAPKLVAEDISRCMRATRKDMVGNFYGGGHHHYQLNQLERQLASLHHYCGSTERAKVSEPNFYKLNPAAGAVLISNVEGSHE